MIDLTVNTNRLFACKKPLVYDLNLIIILFLNIKINKEFVFNVLSCKTTLVFYWMFETIIINRLVAIHFWVAEHKLGSQIYL